MNEDKTQKLAARIASLLQESKPAGDDISLLRLSLEKTNQRLDRIEAQIFAQNLIPHSALHASHSNHPSQEKFDVAEMISAEVSEHFETEKACPYEPAGKPCDYCAMCSSRGF